jgi:hypothetical protein
LRLAFIRDPTEYVSPSHLRREIDTILETLCFPEFGIPEDGQSPKAEKF